MRQIIQTVICSEKNKRVKVKDQLTVVNYSNKELERDENNFKRKVSKANKDIAILKQDNKILADERKKMLIHFLLR